MKTKSIVTIATVAFLYATGFAQTPPSPPPPPPPGAPPGPPDRRQRDEMPKVPVTFLGIETSDVPRVVSEQLGLTKGFGLVVDYVVPDSPAAAAGVQQNDILKMLNDQILTEPDQLSKLIRSYAEGTTITLTVLRKGQEQKLTVKLAKKEVPKGRESGPGRHGHDFNFNGMDFGDLGDQLKDLKDQMGDQHQGMIHDAVMKAQAEAQRARDAAQRVRDRIQRVRDEAQRTRDEAQRERQQARNEVHVAPGQIKVTRADDTGLTTTNIDIRKAQIVFSDDKGELRIDTTDGKRILTAKDPQGRLLFSGPVETKEDVDKVPAEVRDRYQKLQQKDLPSVVSEDTEDADDSEDMDDNDDEDSDAVSVETVSTQTFPHSVWTFRTILV